jgi:hypothetical protein
MSTSDETAKLVQEAIDSLEPPLQAALNEVDWRGRLETTARERQLSPEQERSFIAEGMMALVGIESVRDLADNLVKELGITPAQALELEDAFTENVLTPVMDAAERRGMNWDTAEVSDSVSDGVDPGESKIFESGNFVVTTERFVYGSKVVQLDDITGGALPFVDRGWMGMFIIAGIGTAMLMWGGGFWKFVGLLCLPAAYFFFKFTIDRRLVLSANGEGLDSKVETTELLTSLAEAINKGISGRKSARSGALREELSKLPAAHW